MLKTTTKKNRVVVFKKMENRKTQNLTLTAGKQTMTCP